MPEDCLDCNRKVAKNAKALRCAQCREWCHVTCGGLEEGDYAFLTKRGKYGFRWYCDGCVVDADDAVSKGRAVDEIMKKFQNVESLVSDSMVKFGERLDDLEKKCGSTNSTPQPEIQPVKFAEIVKSALKEDRVSNAAVVDPGQPKNIENQNFLIIKPKENGTAADDATGSVSGIEEVLGEIQVTSCRKTRSGGFLMKFPSEEEMKQASQAIDEHLGPDHVMKVTEPKKMLPKMTVPDISLFLADEDIVPSILRKNPNIKQLVNSGHTLSLIFTRSKAHGKTAVLKMAPEIRSEIIRNGSRIYVGLSQCRAYDRFWVNKCSHCQRFGHTNKSAECPKKDSTPVCAFCAGSHESRTCTQKSSPQCANCLHLANRTSPANHFATSLTCPVLILQRKRVVENTNFGNSKNE